MEPLLILVQDNRAAVAAVPVTLRAVPVLGQAAQLHNLANQQQLMEPLLAEMVTDLPAVQAKIPQATDQEVAAPAVQEQLIVKTQLPPVTAQAVAATVVQADQLQLPE